MGGTTTGARNVISGNVGNGVQILGPGAMYNLVAGNDIGTNAAGTGALRNHSDGVVIDDGATHNTVGGTSTGARNVISANVQNGVALDSNDNVIEGNYIGTDYTGSHTLGNLHDGVLIHNGASDNTIGGNAAGARNAISGNSANGVEIAGSNTFTNVVERNFIGTDASGSHALGNHLSGVYVNTNATLNVIGPGNVIEHNGKDGVLVNSDSKTQVLGNSIYQNTGTGIAYTTKSPYTPPIITSAKVASGKTTIKGEVYDAPASTKVLVQLFSSPGGNQGETLIASFYVTTNARGSASFSTIINKALSLGSVVTLTVTVTYGGTSQFSSPFKVVDAPVGARSSVATQTTSSLTSGAFLGWTGRAQTLLKMTKRPGTSTSFSGTTLS